MGCLLMAMEQATYNCFGYYGTADVRTLLQGKTVFYYHYYHSEVQRVELQIIETAKPLSLNYHLLSLTITIHPPHASYVRACPPLPLVGTE